MQKEIICTDVSAHISESELVEKWRLVATRVAEIKDEVGSVSDELYDELLVDAGLMPPIIYGEKWGQKESS